jgi:hypothetical protein
MAKPKLRALLICDQVVDRPDGQRDIVGLKRVFTVDRLPVKARFTVFAMIDDMPPGEAVFSVRFTGDQGIELAHFRDPHRVHPEFDGAFSHVYEVFCEIQSHGRFELVYLVDDVELGRLPFTVEPPLPVI